MLLVSQTYSEYSSTMSKNSEVEKLALNLSETERALLAARLLDPLPSVLHDQDGDIAEALRRDAELDATPTSGLSLEQVNTHIAQRRTS